MKLTAIGESVREDFIRAFDGFGEAVLKLRQQASPFRVHIATSLALAQLWLAPRLGSIRQGLEGIDISVTTLENPPDLKRGPFDLCLFYVADPEPHQIRLCEEEIFPVCTPVLAQKVRSPNDLADVTCIADVVWTDWKIWAAAAIPGRAAPLGTGPGFPLHAIAVQEALRGLGVLMGRKSLVQPYLASGALVRPMEGSVPLGPTIATWTLSHGGANRRVNSITLALKNHA